MKWGYLLNIPGSEGLEVKWGYLLNIPGSEGSNAEIPTPNILAEPSHLE